MEKIFLFETIRHRNLIFDIASPSGPLPSLFKLCPWGQKWPCPSSHMFCIGFIKGNHSKIFLSETTRPRALIFRMKHHLKNTVCTKGTCAFIMLNIVTVIPVLCDYLKVD